MNSDRKDLFYVISVMDAVDWYFICTSRLDAVRMKRLPEAGRQHYNVTD